MPPQDTTVIVETLEMVKKDCKRHPEKIPGDPDIRENQE